MLNIIIWIFVNKTIKIKCLPFSPQNLKWLQNFKMAENSFLLIYFNFLCYKIDNFESELKYKYK